MTGCTFLLEPRNSGEVVVQVPCNRLPISADYYTHDPVRGDQLIASLCSWHDQSKARAHAAAKMIERRPRKPELAVVG